MSQTLFGNEVPATIDNSDGTTYTLGIRFTPGVNGTVTHGRWYHPTTGQPGTPPSNQIQIGVYRVSDQALLGSTTFPASPPPGWNQVAFGSPIALAAGVTYAVVIWTPQRYVATTTYPWPLVSGNLTATSANGWFTSNSVALEFPTNQSGNAASYFADVVFEPDTGGATPTGLAIPAALGNPTASLVSATPNGIAIPVGLGSPVAALGRTAAPNGLAVALALGVPSVSVNRAAAPSGLAIPVALGFSGHGPIPGILTPSGRPAATLTAAGTTPTLTAS